MSNSFLNKNKYRIFENANLSAGAIIAGYVPYTGATSNININSKTLSIAATSTANGFIELSRTGLAGPGTGAANTLRIGSSTTGQLVWVTQNAGSTDGYRRTISGTLTGHRTYTLQDADATLAQSTNDLSFFAATTSSQLAGVISDEVGSGFLVFNDSPVFTTQIVAPTIYGSTASGGGINIYSTSHATKGTIQIGTTGTINLGNYASPTAQRLVTIGQDTAWMSFGSIVGSTSFSAIYFNQTTLNGSTYGIAGGPTFTTLNSSTQVTLRISNSNRLLIQDSLGVVITPGTQSSGAVTGFTYTNGNNTGQTAGANIPSVLFTLGSTQFATGSQAAQDFVSWTQPTASYVGASTSTLASTFSIAGAVNAGTNATITTSVGLLIKSAAVNGTGTVGTSYGAYINAQTGATTNWALGTTGSVNFLTANSSTDGFMFRDLVGTSTIPAIYSSSVTPSSTNYTLQISGGTTPIFNGTANIIWRINDVTQFSIASSAITIGNGVNFVFNTATGSKIGSATNQKLSFWNATPVVQPTTSVATSTFVANTSGIVDDSATFGGYKLSQIVKALQTIGLLA